MLFEWSSIHTVLKMTNGRELCLFPCRGVCLIYPVSRWNRGCRCWMQCHVTVLCFYVHHPWSLSTGGRGGSDFHQKKRKKKENQLHQGNCVADIASASASSLSLFLLWFRRQKYMCASFFKKKWSGDAVSVCVVSCQCSGTVLYQLPVCIFCSTDLIWSIHEPHAGIISCWFSSLKNGETRFFSPTTTHTKHTVAVNLKEEGTCLRLLPTVDHHFPVHFTIRFPPIKHY